MDRQALSEELKSLIKEHLELQGLELVDLILRQEGRGLVLRVLADRLTGGISLGECAVLNSSIGELLDQKGTPEESYLLEVSSPGVDRPLETRNDFIRCTDKRVRVFLKEPWREKWEYEGIINKVTPEILYLATKENIAEIPLTLISKAKQIV